MGDEKIGIRRLEHTTFTDGSASRSVISAPNSTIVVGRNMLIGGLLKVIVHRPGWVRSVLYCAPACSLPRCVALVWVIIFSSLVKNPTAAIGSPREPLLKRLSAVPRPQSARPWGAC